MPQFLYSRKQDNFHRSLEVPAPSSSATIRNPPREFFPVSTDGDVAIHVPLKYLADTALIEVTGDGECTLHGRNPYVVFIRNGIEVSDTTLARIAKPTEKAARIALAAGVGSAVTQSMETSGIGAKISGSIRNAVHGTIHSSMSNAGKAVGMSFETTQAAANFSSKAIAGAGRWATTKAVAAGVSNVVGGIGLLSIALEADTTGQGASYYDSFYSGRAEDGNGVSYFVKGAA